MNEGKKLISLASIAKQKTIAFEYNKNLSKISNIGERKEGPKIQSDHRQADSLKQKSEREKSNNQMKDRLKLELSTKNGKQLFGEVGLSTLMDISVSTVKEKYPKSGSNHWSIWKTSRQQKKLTKSIEEQDMEELKRRSKRILSQQLNLPTPKIYIPSCVRAQPNPDESLVVELRKKILEQKMQRWILKIKVYVLKKIRKEVYVFDTLKFLLAQRQKSLKKRVIRLWSIYVQEEGQRKVMMEAIRQRVIDKREDQELKKEVEALLQLQFNIQ